jgi:UDP-2-acetamido-3-amino-2,3-dideoxy-glucuronate N-acetyltransferase
MIKDSFVHSTASLAQSAVIGLGTKIWINVQIRENSVVGEFCTIGKDVYIDADVTVGSRCKIQNGVYIYTGVTLHDDVFVGPNATFTNDKVPRAFNDSWRVVETIVRKGASIGANATIVCGITIGEFAMVAAGSVVTRDVPSYTLVMGNPAKPVSKIDRMGHRVEGNL